jgi:hypothetical protein
MNRIQFVIVTGLFIVIAVAAATTQRAYAQQNSTTAIAAATNYTKLFSENKEFRICILGGSECFPAVDVAYQGPTMLVFKSGYLDIVWKAVELAKKEGYKIDGVSTYTTTSERIGGGTSGTINVLVVMSKG